MIQKKRVALKISKDFTSEKFDVIRDKIKNFRAPKAFDEFYGYWGFSHPILFILILIIMFITRSGTFALVSMCLLALSFFIWFYIGNGYYFKKCKQLDIEVNAMIYELFVNEFEKVCQYISSQIKEYAFNLEDIEDFKNNLPKNNWFTNNKDFTEQKFEIEYFYNKAVNYIVNKLNGIAFKNRKNHYHQLLLKYKNFDLNEYYPIEQESIKKKYEALFENGYKDLDYKVERKSIVYIEMNDFKDIIDKQYFDILNSHLKKSYIDEIYKDTKNLDYTNTISYFELRATEGYGGFLASNIVSKILKVKFDNFKDYFIGDLGTISKYTLSKIEAIFNEIEKTLKHITSYDLSNRSLVKMNEQLLKEKIQLTENNNRVNTTKPYNLKDYSYATYANICWKCHKPLNSESNEKCSVCGWLICNYCGACQEGGCAGSTERNRRSR